MNARLLAVAASFVLCAATASPVAAQLATPNAAGAALGYIHINAADVGAQAKFLDWLGGKIVQREKLHDGPVPWRLRVAAEAGPCRRHRRLRCSTISVFS